MIHVYMRCSGKESLDGDTWNRQSEAAACFLSRNQNLISNVIQYREEAVPGKLDSDHRPSFSRLLQALQPGDVVIVERLDRLARLYSTQESLILQLYKAKATLYSADTGENITEAFMGDPMRRFVVQIQGLVAELDAAMIAKKLRVARERIRKENGRCEGRKPFGTRPGEQQTLELIFTLHNASPSCSPERIADYLNLHGHATRYGKRWHSGTVSKILARCNSNTH